MTVHFLPGPKLVGISQNILDWGQFCFVARRQIATLFVETLKMKITEILDIENKFKKVPYII